MVNRIDDGSRHRGGGFTVDAFVNCGTPVVVAIDLLHCLGARLDVLLYEYRSSGRGVKMLVGEFSSSTTDEEVPGHELKWSLAIFTVQYEYASTYLEVAVLDAFRCRHDVCVCPVST